MSNTAIPATHNKGWGFWGTMGGHACIAWPLAISAVADATDADLDTVRAFLDSRHGRHFADDVQNGLYEGKALPDAIHAATGRWMDWTIGRQISKDYGIPRGLPYLTGFVIHCEIVESGTDESLAA
ncbi:MAG: hypothetical protein JSS05_04015 [Proteobacteria bacterium]|nr:hypothetical protein [Pseudomonadota bacterium]